MAGALAMFASLIVVPVVSLVTPKLEKNELTSVLNVLVEIWERKNQNT